MSEGVLRIERRFCGPPDSGNGGYVCGRLAASLGGRAVVRLLVPPPLEKDLRIAVDGGKAELSSGDTAVATARTFDLDLVAPPGPSAAQAATASKAFVGFAEHVFPRCFVCGPERAEGDGLRIFAGPFGDDGRVAAPWRPDASLCDASGVVRAEFVWAALDCPGGFAFERGPENVILLGELAARIEGPVREGEACVALAWELEARGRRHTVATALYGEDGTPRAVARATWIEVPEKDFNPR